MPAVTVRVPASTSNLGPGFDCLGVALRIYNRFNIVPGGENSSSPVVKQAAARFFKEGRVRPFSFSISIDEKVPRSRGLGSSATVRVAVLCALNSLSGNPLDPHAIFRACARLEGHPDNAAPACFGGFTVARGDRVQRFAVSPRLKFVLLVPAREVNTSAARKILPRKIPRIEAVESSANACAITAALISGKYESLRGAFADQLHQPYRQKVIPFFPRVISAAEKAGALGAFLSGSGSTVAAVTLQSPQMIAEAMLRAIRSIPAGTIVTTADNRGVQLRHH
jgi:homoserine kinase